MAQTAPPTEPKRQPTIVLRKEKDWEKLFMPYYTQTVAAMKPEEHWLNKE